MVNQENLFGYTLQVKIRAPNEIFWDLQAKRANFWVGFGPLNGHFRHLSSSRSMKGEILSEPFENYFGLIFQRNVVLFRSSIRFLI